MPTGGEGTAQPWQGLGSRGEGADAEGAATPGENGGGRAGTHGAEWEKEVSCGSGGGLGKGKPEGRGKNHGLALPVQCAELGWVSLFLKSPFPHMRKEDTWFLRVL